MINKNELPETQLNENALNKVCGGSTKEEAPLVVSGDDDPGNSDVFKEGHPVGCTGVITDPKWIPISGGIDPKNADVFGGF